MATVTIRQIREFAQQQIAAGKCFFDYNLDETMGVEQNNLYNIVFAESPEYLWDVEYNVCYEFDDQGVLMAQCYPFADVTDMGCRRKKMLEELIEERHVDDLSGWEYTRAFSEIEMEVMDKVPFPEPEFVIEVPLIRGYSDTPRRDDTQFTTFSLNAATEEAIEQRLGTQRIKEWELRQAMHVSGMVADLGMCSDEVDDLVSMAV